VRSERGVTVYDGRLFTELVAANITERLLSQFYMQKETGYELRQSGDATHARKEVTTGKSRNRRRLITARRYP